MYVASRLDILCFYMFQFITHTFSLRQVTIYNPICKGPVCKRKKPIMLATCFNSKQII